jgi:hypothetical protein
MRYKKKRPRNQKEKNKLIQTQEAHKLGKKDFDKPSFLEWTKMGNTVERRRTKTLGMELHNKLSKAAGP